MVPDSGHDMPADRPDAIVAAVLELCTPQNQLLAGRAQRRMISPTDARRTYSTEAAGELPDLADRASIRNVLVL